MAASEVSGPAFASAAAAAALLEGVAGLARSAACKNCGVRRILRFLDGLAHHALFQGHTHSRLSAAPFETDTRQRGVLQVAAAAVCQAGSSSPSDNKWISADLGNLCNSLHGANSTCLSQPASSSD